LTCDYKLILADERSTALPENTFDKIIIINSFHEFTFVTEMLADIKKKLKPGGILYIDEALPKRPGQLHGICDHPMQTNEETIAEFKKTVLNIRMRWISITGRKCPSEPYLHLS
jgi:ubiquinone/menaquinone biosynthesis C-methylase UbiE